jgi:hypothetical protein
MKYQKMMNNLAKRLRKLGKLMDMMNPSYLWLTFALVIIGFWG